MNRRNGTSTPPVNRPVVVTYRELAPSPELRGHVRAYFSLTPGGEPWGGRRAVTRQVHFTVADSFCSPLFADGHTSLVLNLGATCQVRTGWTSGTPLQARVIGALRAVGAPAGSSHSEMIGAYLEPGATSAVLHAPAVELTDRVVDLQDLWGADGAHLAEDVAELDEAGRVDRLETVLLARVRSAPTQYLRVNVVGLARLVRARPTSMSARDMVAAAGVSRQHLARVFRPMIGVSPKRYYRLARFQAGLAYAGAGPGVNWAEAAAGLGYADQSHMIAEFRELSGLSPDALARQRWFHPFILEARSRIALQHPATSAGDLDEEARRGRPRRQQSARMTRGQT